MKRLLFIIVILLSLNIVSAQWTTGTGLPLNGYVCSIVAVDNNIFAAVLGNGVYLSTNNGGSWVQVLTDNVISLGVNDTTLFVGTAGTNAGVYVSPYNGANWATANNGLQSTTHEVSSFASTGSYTFAGVESSGVYVTTNNGGTWTAASHGLGTLYSPALAASGSNIYAAGQPGGVVYISYDYGNHWFVPANNGLTGFPLTAIAVSNNSIFTGSITHGLFLSTDSGANWQMVDSGMPANSYITSLFANTGEGACKPLVFAGTPQGGVYESINNGISWTPIGTGLPSDQISALLVIGNTIFAGTTSGGVYQRTLPSVGGNITPPQIAVSKSKFCANDSSQLCSTSGFRSYNWNNGVTGMCLVAKQAGIYYVSVTDSNGCTAVSSPDTISVYPAPVDSITTYKNIFCNGDSTAICSLSGFAAYQWNMKDVGSGNCIMAKQPGNYYVSVVDSNGCTAISNSVALSLYQVPVDSITTDKTIFCNDDSTVVCALPGFVSYQWNAPGLGSGNCIAAKEAGNYYVTVTDNNGCTTESNHIPISVFPVPSVSIVVQGDTLASFGAVSYQWYRNGSPIRDATSSIYIAKEQGSYSVAITDANGCNTISNPVDIAMGIKEIEAGLVSLYPNPSNGSWQLEVSNELIGSKLEVYDVEGRVIFQSEIKTLKSKINLDVANGVYWMWINSGEAIMVRKLIRF